MAQQTQQTLPTLQANLIHDIRDFTHIFHRNPTPAEVLDWAQDIYHHPTHGSHQATHRWVRDVIHLATAGDIPAIVFPRKTSQHNNTEQ